MSMAVLYYSISGKQWKAVVELSGPRGDFNKILTFNRKLCTGLELTNDVTA